MTDSFETILNHILSEKPDIPREEILSLVDRKKRESHGLLSDEGALRLVAQQMSLAASSSPELHDQRIASVQAGLRNVSISGEVVSISELSGFQRSDGSTGKVLRMVLADQSGRISCALWDALAEFAVGQGLRYGSRVRLEHGYTRYGPGGEVQYQLGQDGSIQPLGLVVTPLEVGPLRIVDMFDGHDLRTNSLRVRVRRVVAARSEKGPVLGLCEDETGLIVVKFWDEAREAILSREGTIIRIQNSRVVERNGLLYVNVGNGSLLGADSEAKVSSPAPVPIGKLEPGRVLRIVQGKVLERGDPREIETREGRRVRVSNIKIGDSTGKIQVSLWDKHADTAENLRVGDMVKLTAVKVRKAPFTGEPEASTVFLSEIEKIPSSLD